jgi:SAM-dependent methyltransferase
MNPRPTRDAMGAFYVDEYWSAPTEEAAPATRASARALEYLARDHPGGRVLDVGCGTGQGLLLLRRAGLKPIGLEPSEHACLLARESGETEVAQGRLDQADFAPESFDAVTFFHVLEHLHDPLGDLRRVRGWLRPGGAVVIEAPNVGSWQARLLGPWWFGLDVPRHLVHFTPATLCGLLETAGFRDARCTASPEPTGAPMFEASVRYRWRALRQRPDTHEGPPAEPAAPPSAATLPQASMGARAARWLVRNVLYAPVAVENLVGRSVILLGHAVK